jgi:hypothetical protein
VDLVRPERDAGQRLLPVAIRVTERQVLVCMAAF